MPKKKKKEEEGGGEAVLRGLTISLFILLLAFFIVLNTLADEDEKRAKAAMGSLRGAFSSISGGASLIQSSGDEIAFMPDPLLTDSSLRTHKIVGLDHNSSGKVFIRTTPEGIIISIPYEVIFIENTYKLKQSTHSFLLKICEIINDDEENYPVYISGHTDSRPPEEKAVESNWNLTSLKALEVLKFFIEEGGVVPTRITAYGCADYQPISSNETRQTRAQNRRIDITVDHAMRAKVKKIYEDDPSSFYLFKKFVFDIFGG